MDLLFSTFYREGSVIAEISLTFDEPVGESEVESLLLDASNDGSLGNLKVESFSVGPTISGVYKLSTKVIQSASNKSWVRELQICTTDVLPPGWKLSEPTLLTFSSSKNHLRDALAHWVYTKNII